MCIRDSRSSLLAQFGITAQALPGPQLRAADLVVWAVKPQVFREAALHQGLDAFDQFVAGVDVDTRVAIGQRGGGGRRRLGHGRSSAGQEA